MTDSEHDPFSNHCYHCEGLCRKPTVDLDKIREIVKNYYRARAESMVAEELCLTQLFVAVGLDPADPLGEDKT